MSRLMRHSPLGLTEAQFSDAGASISEERFLGIASIATRALSPEVRERLETALGATIPDVPNQVVSNGAVDIAWTAPGEWLLLGEESAVDALCAGAREALHGAMAIVAPLSHGKTAFRASGENARAILSSLMPLDFHHRAFHPATSARSLLGECAAFVQKIDGAPTFRLVVDQSYAEYAFTLLKDAAEAA